VPQGPPKALTSAQRAVARANELAAGAEEREAERAAEERRRLGERPEPEAAPSHQEATDLLLSAFPGTEVLEDWQQIGHTDWVDRRTGIVTHEHPKGAVPLING
jgi:hypothetical protein